MERMIRQVGNRAGPVNLLVRATCLTLMLFESAFGICIGCKLHNALPGRRAQAGIDGAASPLNRAVLPAPTFGTIGE